MPRGEQGGGAIKNGTERTWLTGKNDGEEIKKNPEAIKRASISRSGSTVIRDRATRGPGNIMLGQACRRNRSTKSRRGFR